jgi:hypothetical protein
MDETRDRVPEPRFTGEPAGSLPAPGQPERSLPDVADRGEATPGGGRVDAGAAVTGEAPGSEGQAPPGGLPDDDATLEGDRA